MPKKTCVKRMIKAMNKQPTQTLLMSIIILVFILVLIQVLRRDPQVEKLDWLKDLFGIGEETNSSSSSSSTVTCTGNTVLDNGVCKTRTQYCIDKSLLPNGNGTTFRSNDPTTWCVTPDRTLGSGSTFSTPGGDGSTFSTPGGDDDDPGDDPGDDDPGDDDGVVVPGDDPDTELEVSIPVVTSNYVDHTHSFGMYFSVNVTVGTFGTLTPAANPVTLTITERTSGDSVDSVDQRGDGYPKSIAVDAVSKTEYFTQLAENTTYRITIEKKYTIGSGSSSKTAFVDVPVKGRWDY